MKIEKVKINIATLIISHCLAPLFLGGILYILFRSTNLRMFKWFTSLGLKNTINYIRECAIEYKNDIPNWAYFSLPDGLWIYSFTSAILIYWYNDIKKTKLWLLIPFITGVLTEILQGLKLFPGTFDNFDLSFSVLGISLSIIIINYKFKQNEKTVS
jgi:hypothetical protein